MSVLENSESPQVNLVHEFGQAFEKRDPDLLATLLHKDYRHITLPRSIARPEEAREEWLQHIGGFLSLWTESGWTIHSLIETPGKVVVHVTTWAKTTLGVDLNRESIFIVHIATDEDGSLKIKALEDFTDSKTYLDFVKAVAAAKAGREHSASYAA
ncbi:hypothetical protein BJ322DRAFT_1081686 [Thelephora terrestris]|uniref:SnoaL-like domain-containing protein n=1 Tax=Thelephora terrestris TaxID=56493 RepID=A0A9P6L2S2_9AGAM|nr:hypothetical protein BJ322DRAFT_1081686 [Thelephora terrestris]